MTGNSCMGGHLYELPVTGSVQLRTFKQVIFKSGLMEKSPSAVDLFVPEGTPTRWGGGVGAALAAKLLISIDNWTLCCEINICGLFIRP
jgi:hypothetical protein